MRKIWMLLAIALFVTSAAFGYTAVRTLKPQPIYGTVVPLAETKKYVDMAVKYSPYKKPWFRLPKIDIVPEKKFRKISCGTDDCTVLGYTRDDERDVVHVIATIPDEVAQQLGWSRDEIIVHELIHWLQIAAGQLFPVQCADRDAVETEAYNGQYQYAIKELHKNHGFWKPNVYGNCILTKMGIQKYH